MIVTTLETRSIVDRQHIPSFNLEATRSLTKNKKNNAACIVVSSFVQCLEFYPTACYLSFYFTYSLTVSRHSAVIEE